MAIFKNTDKKIAFSAIQPSGTVTLGNYLGAVKNWVAIQDEYNCIFSLADLHTITVRQDPKTLRKNTLEAYALMLACGIDREKSLFFIQSQVDTHAQMAWILSCFTQFGELSRMTQFKDKSKTHSDNINCGLFTYPSLMTADILLYNADYVPVGMDQKQHLELARNIAERFNGIYGNVFVVPEVKINKSCAKIMSLQDPNKKMSKSDSNVNSFISILDKPDDIIRKFKRAVTDSDSKVRYSKGKPGVSNLIKIYSALTEKSVSEIESLFENKGYGDFKKAVGETVADYFAPIQDEFHKIIKDKAYLERCYKEDATKAKIISDKTLKKAMKKVGFIL